MSSHTSTWPVVEVPAPIPIVDMLTAASTAAAASAGTISMTTLNARAASRALALAAQALREPGLAVGPGVLGAFRPCRGPTLTAAVGSGLVLIGAEAPVDSMADEADPRAPGVAPSRTRGGLLLPPTEASHWTDARRVGRPLR